MHGYYIEISKAQSGKAPAHYTRRQTTKNAERYITEELKTFEDHPLRRGESGARVAAAAAARSPPARRQLRTATNASWRRARERRWQWTLPVATQGTPNRSASPASQRLRARSWRS